jgi:hypothetical protein
LGSRRLVPACFKLEEELLAEADGLAGREGVGRPAAARRAVRRYLESLGPAATPRMAVYGVRGGGAGGRETRAR